MYHCLGFETPRDRRNTQARRGRAGGDPAPVREPAQALPGRDYLPLPVKAAWITDLLEEDISPLQPLKNGLNLELKPYQIVTLRVLF